MQRITNNSGLSLSLAVWLAHDEYSSGQEEHADKNLISATALLKPTRQIVLAPRVPVEERLSDVQDMIPSRLGHAIHDSIERAWTQGYASSLSRLGYPDSLIKKIRINPTPDELSHAQSLNQSIVPVYLEQRAYREITVKGIPIIISGKFDQIIDGELNDTKTTSAYAWINRTKISDYQIQGSIYRWLNPDLITSDVMYIQHVFTDWQRSKTLSDKNYPPSRVMEERLNLMSLSETEAWIRKKLTEILHNQELPEDQIIRCTDKELWKTDPVYKYYSDPKKAQERGKSTKNFPNYPAAAMHLSKQQKGVIVTVPGKVKACGYCPAAPICSQKNEYDLGDNE